METLTLTVHEVAFDRTKPPTNLANRARRKANRNSPASIKARLERLAVATGALPWSPTVGLSQDEKMAKRRVLLVYRITAAQMATLSVAKQKHLIHNELKVMGLRPPKIGGKLFQRPANSKKEYRRENQTGGYVDLQRSRSNAAKRGWKTRRAAAAV